MAELEMTSPLDDDSNFDIGEWIGKKHDAFEESVIKKIFAYYNMKEKVAELRRKCQEVTGSPRLCFEILEELYPDFNVRLFSRSVPYVHHVTLIDLFKRFTKTLIWKEYESCLDLFGVPAYAKSGLAFNMPGVGVMVMHNTHAAENGGTRIQKDVYDKITDTYRIFTIEPLNDFLSTINISGWVK